jgi:competence protein ComEC
MVGVLYPGLFSYILTTVVAYRFHIVLCAFALGVAFQTLFVFSLPITTWVFVVAFGVMLIWYKNSRTISATYLFTVSLGCLFIGLGLLRTDFAWQQFNHSPLEAVVGQPVSLTGIVKKEPEVRENSTYLYVQTGTDLLLVTTDRHTKVSYGDEVFIEGELERPEVFTTDLGREFNYPGYLLARGVEYKISFASVETLSNGNGSDVITFLLAQKQGLIDGIESVITEPQAGLGTGLLLGVKQALGEDLENAFRTTGIIHIVVLSGYNVMLVVAFVMFMLSFLLPRTARFIAGIVSIILFALIVGLSATVVRACVMASLLLIAQAYGRTYDIVRALLFAGTVMIAINPFLLLYDIGFQFSFMATLGLVLIAPRFESFLSEGFHQLGVKDFLVATIATQIAVLPLLLYYIGEVSLIAVVVNVLVLPVVPVAMLATFLAGVIALISTTAAIPFAFVAYIVLTYITTLATFFATVPFASLSVTTFTLPYVFLLYGLIAAVLVWLHRKNTTKRLETTGWTIEEEKEPSLDDSTFPLTSSR